MLLSARNEVSLVTMLYSISKYRIGRNHSVCSGWNDGQDTWQRDPMVMSLSADFCVPVHLWNPLISTHSTYQILASLRSRNDSGQSTNYTKTWARGLWFLVLTSGHPWITSERMAHMTRCGKSSDMRQARN